MTKKKFFLDQHGCAKNQVDGEIIITRLLKAGLELCDNADDADLIIINSCGFIESAKTESLNSLMQARSAFPDKKILLAGCLAERYADVFKSDLPEADGIFGNGDLTKIDDVVSSIFENQRPVVKPLQKGVCCGDRERLLNYKGSAFVKITEGCNNCCSFCAIPLIRGNLRSRNADEIVEEIKGLLEKGIFEINLIGQDLAAYGCGKDDDVFLDGKNDFDFLYTDLKAPLIDRAEDGENKNHSALYRLLEKISALEGKFWLRLLYIHPDHFNKDILDLMERDHRILPYFDIPFQSGCDQIIHAMNRKGSFSSYVNLIKTIRQKFPQSAIRTTFLTGFPAESDQNHKDSVEFLKAIQADWSGCFTYSREDDTPAAKMKNQVRAKKSLARKEELESLQEKITADRLQKRCGKDYEVLVEEIIENNSGSDEGLALGRAWFQAPEVDGAFVIRYDRDDKDALSKIQVGNIVKVHALASSQVDMDGEYLG